jgi:predicted kinase
VTRMAVIGIGNSGSGKSFMLKPLAIDTGAIYISSDEVREDLNGSRYDQANMGEVWDIMYVRIELALKQQTAKIVVDSTNARKVDRLRLINFCRDHGATVDGLWFQTPVELCLQRNVERAKARAAEEGYEPHDESIKDAVPEYAILRMAYLLDKDPPRVREGFNSLIIIPT